ncbi:MAG: hypothetical protein OEM39_06375 [Acidimicrobiia bacterium]|nr:hypothetical protein [Acidimicrobiia bacterium]MDH3462153.1 hypothetical protein [Acidimicrobiia bacterium]
MNTDNSARRANQAVAVALTQAASAVGRTVFHFVVAVVTLDLPLVLLGWMRPKEMWVSVGVLSDQGGAILDRVQETAADEAVAVAPRPNQWDELDAAIDEARRILLGEANVVLKPEANSDMITVVEPAAPDYALRVGCNSRAYREGLGDTGSYFESTARRIQAGSGTRAPDRLTVFIVEDIEGKSGCSLGPLADYVTVDLSGLVDRGRFGHAPWTLAHEIGHACNLWHYGDTLMRPHPEGRKDYLKRWQRALFRASGHVRKARPGPQPA